MKKLIVQAKWKRYLRARGLAQARANAKFAAYLRAKNSGRIGYARIRRQKFSKTITLTAPENFSLIHNPNETIQFLNDVRAVRRSANVFVNLSDVKQLTPDSIAALLATINLHESVAEISGSMPTDAAVAAVLETFGFFEHVHRPRTENLKPALGSIKKQLSRENVRFDQFQAAELIRFAVNQFRGSPGYHQATYSVFGEAMLNTVYHATAPGGRQPEPWWASVYCDTSRRRACFTFVDQGVGIFKSHKLAMTLQAAQKLRLLSHARILRRLMRGLIPSSSKVRGRGNGIPGMYRHCKANRIRELNIIANDAMANGETDVYTQLATPFGGTILYWEIEL